MSLEDLTPAQRQELELGALLLRKNPEIAKEAKRLAKKANPTLVIPEIELEDAITASAAGTQEKLDKLEKELMTERVTNRKRDRDREIVAAGYTVEEIEKIIVDEHCTYETAMKLAGLQRQTAEPGPAEVASGHSPGTPIEMRPEADWRKLDGSGLRKKSAQIASEMINSFRKNRRATA